ncbi:DUF1680-domain-containing protein [Delitschia confertaspora ATCC 74209]|uniref:DUF1680-domain-containing protein n=1 Tax=Delitschia confertaspora ATCC 74209 TaxID=1513339 RepID=A0A9P4JQK1_9PLEO|nr:DUF1680-domain-containing protein [Delitschia confertaspora ATCC 74209]
MVSKLLLASFMLAVPQALAQDIPPIAVPETGVSVHPFDMSHVSLTPSRWADNQNRTLNYLKFIDVDRLLYNFRATHKLSTKGAKANGGWDAPNFPFRSHAQGHYLTAWTHCYATLRDSECLNRATYLVAELAKCQANNKAAGFGTGYLSGFPESEFDKLENGTLTNGNVPYYAVHKTMAGLLDAWRIIGDKKAMDVLLGMAGWVDSRTGKLSTTQMQKLMQTEFGGMNDILANIYQLTNDKRWLTTAQRFDHAAVFDPLAAKQDKLDGLHANTQVPKWIGAVREYKATSNKRYLDIARNAWDITVNSHSYAIGGNSQAEHFHAPNKISTYLTNDTAEQCNTYNMLKLTRDLFVLDPSTTSYFDFYERALINHILGGQNHASDHGHVTYFTPLNPGGKRGVGPAWGGGTWSTDYESFWCCQGTGVESNTKLMDSIYWFDDTSALYINLFTPSTLDWKDRGVKITQATEYPVNDTTTLTVTGKSGEWTMRIRIPSWTSGATLRINGKNADGVEVKPGTYASLTRSWKSGDTVAVQLPMKLRTVTANDNPSIAALAFGPAILSGNYGSSSLSKMPTIKLDSVKRKDSGKGGLVFEAIADGKTVELGPFYEAQGFAYNVYWGVSGQLPVVV